LCDSIFVIHKTTTIAVAKRMSVLSNHINELKASEAFTRQAPVFDKLYGEDPITRYKRKRVRNHILAYAKENGRMLELNCGTGEDAIYFAQKGFLVHATDISNGMLDVLKNKLSGSFYQERITVEQCSFTELEQLAERRAFDCVYSNLGGLNCTGELERVLSKLGDLVTEGGIVTLVIISKFCLWETMLLLKGRAKTATRRFFSRNGKEAQVEGKSFKCWYYNPSFVKKCMEKNFDFLSVEGLCTIVPPSYMDHFANNYPRTLRFLVHLENRLSGKWPWNRTGDYFIISFKKR
jgi:ubiquinone/menaquinone biosynthesis C-methylase UbiE